jgi:hypothetical protein
MQQRSKMASRVLTEEELLQVALDTWTYNSHYWSAPVNAISTCIWCGYLVNGYQGVRYGDIPLCMKNPKVMVIK